MIILNEEERSKAFASAFQAEGRGFEARLPLQVFLPANLPHFSRNDFFGGNDFVPDLRPESGNPRTTPRVFFVLQIITVVW
jgi:hypothetical protein